MEALSNNGVIAALFGPGVLSAPQRTGAQRVRPASRPLEDGATYPQPSDRVELSSEARRAAIRTTPQTASQPLDIHANDRQRDTTGPTGSTQDASSSARPAGIGSEEQADVRKLKQRDQEVRRHEQAHKAAAGGHAVGGPSFEFTRGPDGRQYAIGGEVSLDTSPVKGDPQATIAKMQQIRRAALAPAQPSSQDRAVAAQAAQTEREARTELARENRGAAGKQPGSGVAGSVSSLQGGRSTRPAAQGSGGGAARSRTTNARTSRIAAAFIQAVSNPDFRSTPLLDVTI